jgi:hypothetical protein
MNVYMVRGLRAAARSARGKFWVTLTAYRMLKVGTQNQAKTLKVSAWPDGAKTLKVPGRSETVPRPYGYGTDKWAEVNRNA